MARWGLRLALVCLAAFLVGQPAGALLLPSVAPAPSSRVQGPWTVLGEVGVDLYGVSFYELHKGWAVGDAGTILNTVDGGPHWMWQDSHTEQPLYGVDMFTRYTGWVVGAGGTVRRTDNGGAHWVHQDPGTTATASATSTRTSSPTSTPTPSPTATSTATPTTTETATPTPACRFLPLVCCNA